jgi:general stress protein 26
MPTPAEKLRDLMKQMKFCMLTSNSPEKLMRARPMTLQQSEFDGDLWFFTGLDTTLVSDTKGDPRVNASFSDGSAAFVSVAGRASLVDDAAKKKELWNDMYKTWFPGGVNDPNLTLMKVTIDSAEYWDTPGGKVMQLLEYVQMAVTHKAPKGEHEVVS